MFSSAEVFIGLITVAVIDVGVSFEIGWGLSAGDLLAFLFPVGLIVGPVQLTVEVLDHAQTALGVGKREGHNTNRKAHTATIPIGQVRCLN